MDVHLLELFVSVAEEGSIHGGARRLMIAQPAVSKGLQRLERSVGTALVSRSHKGIELTPAGHALFLEAQDILERMDRAMDRVRVAAKRERSVTIGLIAGGVAAGDLTKNILGLYRQQFPDVTVHLRELNFLEQFDILATREVDIAIVRPPGQFDGLSLNMLFDEPLVLGCPKEHDLALAESVTVEDVLDLPMPDMSGAPKEWTDFWQLAEFRGGPARTASDPASRMSELRMAVEFGGVVTPIAESAYRLGMQSESVTSIPITDSPRSKIAVAQRLGDDRPEVAGLAACAQFIVREMASDMPHISVLC